MVSQGAVVCLALLAVATATDVQQCKGRSDQNLNSRVELSPCHKPPCRLKKGTNQHISIKFTPETDIKILKNSVNAEVLGVPVPFVGVDGLSVCEKVYSESGEKAPCPLKAGNTYTYKDSFPILSFYPSIPVRVTWALEENDGKTVVCFEVPAKIS